LRFIFSYLDLICTDCGVYDESVNNYLVEAARQEYKHFTKHERVERVKIRLDRVSRFISYLKQEEMREREFYTLGMPETEMFTHKAGAAFEVERSRVLSSAKRQPTGPRPKRR
jgi:hypothetical protein